jgi:hypothetical protein
MNKEKKWTKIVQTKSGACGPTTSAMALSVLGIETTESEMIQYEKTSIMGTSHKNLIKGCIHRAAKEGITLSASEEKFPQIEWKELKQIREDPTQTIITHGNTKGWKRFHTEEYEHYVFIIDIDIENNKVTVADPSRTPLLSYPIPEFENGLILTKWNNFIILKMD